MVKIRKYVCVDDVGKPINPLIIEGQVHGGLAQGIAQALFEEAVYDEAGNLTTGTFVDYTLPSAADLPSFITERTVTPSTTNPLGSRASARPARSPRPRPWSTRWSTRCGRSASNDIRMPATPERVWRAIHGQPTDADARPKRHQRLRRRQYQYLRRLERRGAA